MHYEAKNKKMKIYPKSKSNKKNKVKILMLCDDEKSKIMSAHCTVEGNGMKI